MGAAHPTHSMLTSLWRRAFATRLDGAITISVAMLLGWLFWVALDWAVLRSVWTAEDVGLCREEIAGACWSIIDARHRLILFGLYPYEEHWRSTTAAFAIILTIILSCIPWFWATKRIVTLWVVGFASYYLLMEGSALGLTKVTTDKWGGLSLVLFLFSSVVLLGLPGGLGLALMRRSRLPLVRLIASLIIDLIRSLPLLTTLFTAAVVIPILLPEWLQGDKIWRIILAFALFFACYQAEVFRGGFQAIPVGQSEGGASLGLGKWQVLWLITMPQVFRHALPSTINMVVVTFKETAVVIIIGLFDLLASAQAAFGTGEWISYYMETYVFIAFIYWAFISSLSRYGEFLKDRMKNEEN